MIMKYGPLFRTIPDEPTGEEEKARSGAWYAVQEPETSYVQYAYAQPYGQVYGNPYGYAHGYAQQHFVYPVHIVTNSPQSSPASSETSTTQTPTTPTSVKVKGYGYQDVAEESHGGYTAGRFQ